LTLKRFSFPPGGNNEIFVQEREMGGNIPFYLDAAKSGKQLLALLPGKRPGKDIRLFLLKIK
jgi:hypothetical protein